MEKVVVVFSITLNTGQAIEAKGLHIEETYQNYVDGTPTRYSNDRFIRGMAARVERTSFSGPLYLIEPAKRVAAPADPEWLPAFWIAALFHSKPLTPGNDGSGLLVSWFQEEALPVPSESSREALVQIPWEDVARDYTL